MSESGAASHQEKIPRDEFFQLGSAHHVIRIQAGDFQCALVHSAARVQQDGKSLRNRGDGVAVPVWPALGAHPSTKPVAASAECVAESHSVGFQSVRVESSSGRRFWGNIDLRPASSLWSAYCRPSYGVFLRESQPLDGPDMGEACNCYGSIDLQKTGEISSL